MHSQPYNQAQMNIEALEIIKKLRGLNSSKIARMAGVSRQAVSLWSKEADRSGGYPFANVRSATVVKLVESLGIGADRLLSSMKHQENKRYMRDFEIEFNWDKSFPSFTDFVVELLKGDLKALSRFVQTIGLFEASAILGKSIWKRFSLYKRFMHPKRREQCERIWKIQKDLNLI